MRYTPEDITELKENEVFVFGSNESGIHGAGAAKLAHRNFGARYGVGFGSTGQCFAIPTKDWSLQTLKLEYIKFYVDRFYEYVKINSIYLFYITKLGCGLAGYKIEEIAPLFKEFMYLKNAILPKEFVEEIKKEWI